jgi:Rad3-related DNA helicase
MGIAVARAFADDHPLLFEAGTGVGKSLAYLLPGIVHAVDQSRQLIVSTHTISLQEQLETKDLPLCRRILAGSPETSAYAGFRSCVLVGKGDHLCTTRLVARWQRRPRCSPTTTTGTAADRRLGRPDRDGPAARTPPRAPRRGLGPGQRRLLGVLAQALATATDASTNAPARGSGPPK